MRSFRMGVAIGAIVTVAAVSCAGPAAATATTLFSNITGPPTVSSGTSGESFASNFWVAKKFSPTTTGTANLISFWVQCFSGGTCTLNGGSTNGTIQLYTDSNGVPGTALGQPATFSAPPFNAGNPDCAVTSSSPTITAGTKYWAVMKTASSNDGISWEFQDTNADTVEYSTNSGGSWAPLTQQGSNTDRDLSLRIDTGTRCNAHMVPNPTAGTTIGGMYPRSGQHSFDTITIGNDGLATLNLTSYTITETDTTGQTPFTLLNGEPDGMPPGNTYPQQSQVFPGGTAILYTTCTGPTQENHYTATLSIATNDPTQPSISWPLSCYVDNTPPHITISATPDGNHGWFKTNPALVGVIADDGVNGSGTNSLRCTNNGVQVVGVPASGASFNATTEGDNNVSCSASDVAGNVTSTPTTADLKIDSRPPVISLSVTPAPNAAGWHNSATTIGFTCADPTPGSGIDTNTVGGGGMFTAETPKSGQVVSNTGTCTDIAGNTGASGSVTLKLDETPPTTGVFGGPPARTNSTSASFMLSGNDALSGVAGFQCSLDGAAPTPCSATPSYSRLAAGRTHTFKAQAIDVAGNVDGTGASTSWFVDNTPPSVVFDSPAANATVGTNGQISFHATDPDDASGFSYTCRLDGGTVSPCSSPYTYSGLTSGANPHTLSVTASDAATNTGSASLTFNIAAPPMVQASFGASSIPLQGSTMLSLQLTNPNSGAGLSGISVSDALPAGLVVSTPNGESDTCGGNVSADAGSTSIGLTGATLSANGACTLTVNVTGTAAGTTNDTTGQVTATESGTGAASNQASLDVVAPPSIGEAFGASSIPLDGSTSLTIAITSPAANGVALSGISFNDALPSGLVVSGSNGPASTCGGNATGAAGDTSVGLSSGAIATPGNTCTVQVTVTGTSAGAKHNSVAVDSTNGGNGNTATADLAVVSPPTITQQFGATSIPLGSSTSLTFTIKNPAANTVALSGIGFSDSLPAGLVVATNSTLANTCGGIASGAPGDTSISLSGGALPNPGDSCTVALIVTGTQSGDQQNTTGAVTSTDGGTGATSNTATVTVVAPPSVTITAPADGATYSVGQTVSASYSCTEGASGPGIGTCTDDRGIGNGNPIDTSTPGRFSLKVTATSTDGQSTAKTVAYTVAAGPSAAITAPADGVTYSEGQIVDTSYSCTDGSFGPGIATCTDDHGIGNGNPIDTSTFGRFSLKVTAISKDGQSSIETVTYSVAGPPSATITTPPDGGHYFQGQSVNASYSCTDGSFGPGISSCTDDHGIGNGNPIDTSTPGSFTLTVTALSKDGQSGAKTVGYTVAGPPSATIATPADGAHYIQGQSVNASYSCHDDPNGPGIQSCAGPVANGAAIDTSTPGNFTLTVTATSKDTLTGSKTVSYTVAGPPSATITAPADGATYSVGASVGASYSCQDDPNGPGIQSCAGPVANGAAIDTSTPGSFSLKVTATSKDSLAGSKTVTYTVAGPPSVTSTTPPDGGAHYIEGQRVIASYSCTDGAFGPGIDSCTDDHGIGNGNPIDTSKPGSFTLKVTATSKDSLTASKTVSYTVAGPPAATIVTPADGGQYIQGDIVNASYSCQDDPNGPGIKSCVGPVPSGTPIDTKTLGTHAFTVTASSKAGLSSTVTHHYTVVASGPPIVAIAPPSARIGSPADNQIFRQGQHVATSFNCAEAAGGPGISSCADSNGARPPTGRVDTSHIGTFAYTVRATSRDGLTATATIHYNVLPAGFGYRVTHVKVRPNGVVTFDVIVQAAGIVKVMESASKRDEAPLTATAALLQPARGRFVFARGHLTVRNGGTFHMRVAPNKRGKRLVRHHLHRVRIRLWVTFTPPNGHVVQIGFYRLSVTR